MWQVEKALRGIRRPALSIEQIVDEVLEAMTTSHTDPALSSECARNKARVGNLSVGRGGVLAVTSQSNGRQSERNCARDRGDVSGGGMDSQRIKNGDDNMDMVVGAVCADGWRRLLESKMRASRTVFGEQ